MFGGIGYLLSQDDASSNTAVGEVKGNKNVIAYTDMVTSYAQKSGISSEVPELLAIMEVESKGKGLDPMQSSESAGLSPGGLSGPELSIKQCVACYASNVKLASSLGLGNDKKAIIQSYNYGGGYLSWLGKIKQNWTLNNDEGFSRDVLAAMQRKNGFALQGRNTCT